MCCSPHPGFVNGRDIIHWPFSRDSAGLEPEWRTGCCILSSLPLSQLGCRLVNPTVWSGYRCSISHPSQISVPKHWHLRLWRFLGKTGISGRFSASPSALLKINLYHCAPADQDETAVMLWSWNFNVLSHHPLFQRQGGEMRGEERRGVLRAEAGAKADQTGVRGYMPELLARTAD